MNALLAVESLCVGRGDRRLISDLNFRVSVGEVLHLRGRNGAGKSSLIEVLVGLRPAQSGGVVRDARTPMHWVGHRNALNADLSLRENLLAWCALNGLSGSPVDRALDRLELGRLRHRPARTLSAGQKRRGALARLLIQPRPLWILDEPLSGLDAPGLVLLGQLMNEHVSGQGALVVTSHQSLPGKLPRVTVIDLG